MRGKEGLYSEFYGQINHKFLLTKLHTYGFNKDALKIIQNYLNNRYQFTGVKYFLGSSTGGPLLFHIYFKNVIYLVEKN